MSSSNIIKLHNLRPQKVVVGQAPASPRTAVARAQSRLQDATADSDRNEQGLVDESQILATKAEAENILMMARAEADALIEEAHQKAQEMQLQARQEGYQKGYEEALASAKTGLLESVERIAEVSKNTAADMASILNTLEEGLIDLALAIAEKVVHKRLSEDRNLVISMVQGAMEYVDVMDVLRIRINPEDLETFRTHWEQGFIEVSGRNVDLIPDSRVQLGGCVIDTKGSVVDAQIETRLAEIERSFRAELDGSMR